MVFPFYSQKTLTVNFRGGDLSSDGGMLFVRQLDERWKITERLAAVLDDHRDQRYIRHELLTLLRQRLYQIVAGYEDCNDADTLRNDPILKVCCDRALDATDALASQPTFSRLENTVTARDLYCLSEMLLELYFANHRRAPKKIILDMDSTDDPTHGAQQLSLFNGFYKQHMYHPLLVFDGATGEALAAVLRPGNKASSSSVMAILRRLVQRLRAHWPRVRIIVRADGGFATPELYEFCEREGLGYIIGFQRTEPLQTLNKKNVERATRHYQQTGMKVRQVTSTLYRAKSWNKPRRVLMKTEASAEGINQRFVVTNLPGRALTRYDFYGERGQVENQMIKELKLDLQADRLSCHRFLANQFRLLLHTLGYVLLHRLRSSLHGTPWATARIDTLRTKLLKVGAHITSSCRRVWVMLASGYPYQKLWATLFNRLCAIPSG
jgi:hypothetical protein